MTAATVLILGANGRIGASLVQAYAAAGWRVLAQLRRAPAQPLPPGAQALLLPLADTAALVAQAAGAQVVVHAVNPAYDRWSAELMPLARLCMDVAEGLQARLLLPGNVYNYGRAMPPLLRPDTPQQPDVEKGRQRVALEQELAQRARAGRLRASVIRAGDFYGAGRGNWFDQAIAKDLARGRIVYPGPRDVPHAWAYLPDLAQAFVALSSPRHLAQAPAFEALHFAGHTCSGDELIAELQAAAADLGVTPPRSWQVQGLPWGVIRALGLVRPLLRELARMRYLWQVPHALDGTALQAAVGPLPSTPLPQALRATLHDLGLATANREAALSSRGAPA